MEEQIVRLLKLQNKEEFKRVVSLSKQYSQTVSQKKLSGQPIEHPYVCVDLALESGGAVSSNNKEVLFKRSGTTKRCYQDTKRSYRNILGLKDNSSDNLKQIVIKYAPNTCNMVARVKSLQSTFQQRFLKTLSEEQRGFVDFSRPVFTIVAFWSMAKLEKVKVAKQELIHEFDLKQTEFDNIKQQMQEICSDILETKNNSASSSKRKNQNSGNTPSVKKQKRVGEDDEEGGDDENLPSHCINKKALKEREYEEWKENTISNALKLNLVEQNSRKKKQSTITSFMKTLQQVEPIEDNDTDNEQNLR